ncbi:unnamed protein product [Amoebophrya sp. A25]|nr:unnamed protein product [Amoebophrya sp. A25]|eukprot:GSA25T00008880001.1
MALTPVGALLANAELDDEAGTFLSALRLDPKQASKARAREELLDSLPNHAGSKILTVHTELQKLADTLDDRVGSLLDAHERDFFLAYKTHMVSVQKEFNSLKLKADEHETKSRRQAKIQSLEKELRWFMKEALRLDELCKKYLQEMERWKQRSDQLDDDRSFLENQIKKSKGQNRALRLAVEKAQQHAFEALAASGASAAALENDQAAALEDASSAAIQDASTKGDDSGAQSALAALKDEDDSGVLDDGEEGPRGPVVLGALPEKQAERYRKTIKNLQQLLAAEKRKVQKLEITVANTPTPAPLEEYFVRCIQDAKEDVFQRRAGQGRAAIPAPDLVEFTDFTSFDKRTVIDLLFRNPDLIRLLEKKLEELQQGATK